MLFSGHAIQRMFERGIEKGDVLKVIDQGEIIEESHNHPIGHLTVSKKNLLVAVKNGFFKITDLKLAGKRRMDAISLLNGYEFHNGSKMF